MPTAIAARLRRCQAAILSGLLLSSLGGAGSPKKAADAQQAVRVAHRETAANLQAERYEIDAAFEPERSFLSATAALTLRCASESTYVELELNPHLEIKSVQDARSRALEFTRSGVLGSPKFSVRLAEPAAAGQPLVLVFAYEGALPRGELDYITKDGILLRDESRWYPAADFSAFTTNTIKIRVPFGWHAIASGKWDSSTFSQTATTTTMGWNSRRAVSSRSVVAGPGAVWPCSTTKRAIPIAIGAPVEVQTCASLAHQQEVERLWLRTEGILHEFERVLGDFPQDNLTIVEGFPAVQGALGYSAPGFLVVSRDIAKFADVAGYSPEFLPHEIAHQWFPIAVTIEREEDGWLAESIAEYLAWRYLQANDTEAARRLVAAAMRDALAPDPLRMLSLGLKLFAQEPWSVTHATLYQRGMLVFRTLETVIDRERVDRALAEYYRRYQGKSGSISGFRKICEEIAGRNLGWFFDYFLEGTRIPEIELRQTPSGAPGVAAGEIVVKNMPPEATVRVEMRIRTAKGVVEHSVATRGEVTPFTVNVPAPALRIELDPDARILRWTEAARINRAQQVLLAQVGSLEDAGKTARGLELCRRALALDPSDAALNQQRIRFLMGRAELRINLPPAQTGKQFQSVLDGHSLDPVETDFYRAWAHVYRARMARDSRQPTVVRREVQAGLALLAPALDTRVTWRESSAHETSAREALLDLTK